MNKELKPCANGRKIVVELLLGVAGQQCCVHLNCTRLKKTSSNSFENIRSPELAEREHTSQKDSLQILTHQQLGYQQLQLLNKVRC